MKNFLIALGIMLATVFIIIFSSCGGDGSDSGGGTPAGTFTKQSSVINNVSYMGPFSDSTDSKDQFLYTASQIGASGKITKIRMRHRYAITTAVSCPNITIKMGHTSLDTLTTTFSGAGGNVEEGCGSEKTVLDNAALTIPVAAAENWFEISLSAPFDYNGVDNLVVDFETKTKCSNVILMTTTTTGTDRNAYFAAVDNEPGIAEFNPTTAAGVQNSLLWMQFVFEGGDNGIVCADGGAVNGIALAPGSTGRTQMLILASDIKGSGLITGMAINPYDYTNAAQISDMSVKIAHIPAATTVLTTDFAANYGGANPVVVTQNLSYNIPVDQPSAVWIPFNSSDFNYDGTSNLLIDISCMVISGNYLILDTEVPENRLLYSASPNALTGSFPAGPRAVEPVFRFYGSTINVVAPGSPATIYYPFNESNNNTLQYLFTASDLGVNSSINRIALRLSSDVSTASSYDNFTVTLGQTENTVLGDTLFSANFNGTRISYSGTYNVTGGLIKGDWIEIPLQTPFACDPAKNLVVQFSGHSGTARNSIVREVNNTRYLNRQAHADSVTDTVAGTNNCLADIKLEVR
ncbi:MAG: hypothetical protein JXN64_09645 [Spirochaetes bacterium]|nr:hypothetical protein [Spirochaetota bacterium]